MATAVTLAMIAGFTACALSFALAAGSGLGPRRRLLPASTSLLLFSLASCLASVFAVFRPARGIATLAVAGAGVVLSGAAGLALARDGRDRGLFGAALVCGLGVALGAWLFLRARAG